MKDALKALKNILDYNFFSTLTAEGQGHKTCSSSVKTLQRLSTCGLYSKWLLFVRAWVCISTCACHSAAWGQYLARGETDSARQPPATPNSHSSPLIWPRHTQTTESQPEISVLSDRCVQVSECVDETRLTEPFKALQLTLSGCTFIIYLFIF